MVNLTFHEFTKVTRKQIEDFAGTAVAVAVFSGWLTGVVILARESANREPLPTVVTETRQIENDRRDADLVEWLIVAKLFGFW